MITEKELDEMARYYFSDRPEFQERREQWKDNYRARHPDKVTPTTGAANMPPERVENGRQFQGEMIMAGFKKLKLVQPNSPLAGSGLRVDFDIRDAREHMEHVIALVANTATQRAYRQAIEHIETIMKMNGCEGSMYPAAITDIAINLNSTIELLRAYIRRLEAQFADLSEKIFGTDKPAEEPSKPDKAELLDRQKAITDEMWDIDAFLNTYEKENASEGVLKMCFDRRIRYGQLKDELQAIADQIFPDSKPPKQ